MMPAVPAPDDEFSTSSKESRVDSEDILNGAKYFEKPWTVDDEYQFPPKREGDPWQRLLNPILEREKIRCDGWKDEVGNLLIFAGLFSAVVTSFIVESYKTLQSDPNNDIVGLLVQISGQLNSTVGNRTIQETSSLSLPSHSFSPTQSAVRVNAFWFLSLIFSLATVLVGIVALQWLREYQAYPGQSARDALAIQHMRSEGMEKWHVWRILTALPLLLQTALVLFFAGVIDFLDAIGNSTVSRTATAAVGVTLFFLFATTVLPAAQIFGLRLVLKFHPPLKKPPSQCPYKSPQSNLLCAACDTWPQIFGSLVSAIWYPCRRFIGYHRSMRFKHSVIELLDKIFTRPFAKLFTNRNAPVRRHLSSLWPKRAWIDFDSTWLWIRDACSRGYHDRDFNLSGVEIDFNTPTFALFDIMAAILDIDIHIELDRHLEVYHCFSDLSTSFTVSNITSDSYWGRSIRNLWQRNKHLRSFIPTSWNKWADDNKMIERLQPDTNVWDEDYTNITTPTSDAIRVLHEINMYSFLKHNRLDYYRGHHQIYLHLQELRVRIRNHLFGIKVFYPPEIGLPSYLCMDSWGSHQCPLDQRVSILHQEIIGYQRLFRYITRPNTTISSGDLQGHPLIWHNVETFGLDLRLEIIDLKKSQTEGYLGVLDAFKTLLDDIAANLIMPRSGSEESESLHINLLYASYYAAMLLHAIGDESAINKTDNIIPQIEPSYTKLLSVVRVCINQDIVENSPDFERLDDMRSMLIEYHFIKPQAHNTSETEHVRIISSCNNGHSRYRTVPLVDHSQDLTESDEVASSENEAEMQQPKPSSEDHGGEKTDSLSSLSNQISIPTSHLQNDQFGNSKGHSLTHDMDKSHMNPEAHKLA